jgi:hypothetical protein
LGDELRLRGVVDLQDDDAAEPVGEVEHVPFGFADLLGHQVHVVWGEEVRVGSRRYVAVVGLDVFQSGVPTGSDGPRDEESRPAQAGHGEDVLAVLDDGRRQHVGLSAVVVGVDEVGHPRELLADVDHDYSVAKAGEDRRAVPVELHVVRVGADLRLQKVAGEDRVVGEPKTGLQRIVEVHDVEADLVVTSLYAPVVEEVELAVERRTAHAGGSAELGKQLEVLRGRTAVDVVDLA